ncbi:MAG: hypothetical protein R3F38_12775 [Gammaproteobacteria bacterium]
MNALAAVNQAMTQRQVALQRPTRMQGKPDNKKGRPLEPAFFH